MLAIADVVVIKEHENAMLGLHRTKRRSLGAKQEADSFLRHVEGGNVMPILQLSEIHIDLAPIPLLQCDLDGERRELALLGSARNLRDGKRGAG
jgi:hypothetical protein